MNNRKGSALSDGVFFGSIFIGIMLILFLMFSLRVVGVGKVGVHHMFGKVREEVLQSGLTVKNPLAGITTMDVRLQEYTMSIMENEGYKKGDDAIDALSLEGLTVRLDLTAWYRIEPSTAWELYKNVGMSYEEKIIRPTLRTAIRDVVAKYSAQVIYSEKREQISLEIQEKTAKALQEKGIIFEKLLLRNVSLPKELSDAINSKLVAEQDARKMEFVLQKAVQEKDRKVIEAQGIKEANAIIAQGLTPSYLSWYKISMMKELVDSPNNTVIFIPDNINATPLINIK